MELYPNRDWSWYGVSMNPNITWEIIRDNPNRNWDWLGISKNPNITWEIIRDNPNRNWDWAHIAQNKFDRVNAQKVIARNWRRRCKYKAMIAQLHLDSFLQSEILQACMH
jgi:hypothetical protein